MSELEKKDEIDLIVEKSAAAFKEANTFPPFLHAKIMAAVSGDRLSEKPKLSWFRVLPRAAAALAVVFVMVFAGVKIVEKQNLFVYNKLPVAVMLSLQSQADLLNTETELNGALNDSIRGAIFNLEQG